MSKIICPNCAVELEFRMLTKAPTRARPQQNSQISPLNGAALSDIRETLRAFVPETRLTVPALYAEYLKVSGSHGRRVMLTQYAFTLGLKRYGIERWRTSSERGYVIPAELPDEPLQMTSKARERAEAQDYRETVLNRRGGAVVGEKEPDEPFVPPF